MARQRRSILNRDALTHLRALAGEKGYRLERGMTHDTWTLTREETGKPLLGPRGTIAFNVKTAIKLLSALST